MTTARKFSTGKDAMAYLLHGESPGDRSSRSSRSGKTPAQIRREITQAMAERDPGRGPVLSPSSARPSPPFPAGRRGRGSRGAAAAGKLNLAKHCAAVTSPAVFLRSLPPPLTRRGPNSVPVSTVAKRVREECAKAVAACALPPGTKISVRSDHNSLHVDVSEWSGAVFVPDYEEHLMDPSVNWDPPRGYREPGREGVDDPRLTQLLNDAIDLIAKIAERHNYDESDSQTDYFNVGYYLHVDARPVMEAAEAGIKSTSDPAFAELQRQGQIAADALGPKATKSICNGRLDRASKWELEHLIKIAKRADGKPVEYDKQRRGWYPV